MNAFHERTDDYNQSREKNQVWRWNFCKFCCIVLLFASIRGANTHKKDTITVDDMKKEAEREARTMWQFIRTFLKWLIIAGVTGGIGGLFKSSTNYPHITGDSFALAIKHGITLQDMSYIQIHPTTLYSKKSGRRFLISESVRGEGAILLNENGERFTDELQPRDVVTEAIV